ncbi:hypothetical protein GCM10009412_26590 [Aeromonas salmonicida subsp. achromogenes]
MIDEHSHPHSCLIDVGHPLIQGSAWAGHHAGDVVTHLAWHGARLEIRGARGDRFKQPGKFEGVVGTGVDAEPAAHTGTEELGLVEGCRRTQCLGGHRRCLLTRHSAQTDTKQAHTAGPLGHVGQKLAATTTHLALPRLTP